MLLTLLALVTLTLLAVVGLLLRRQPVSAGDPATRDLLATLGTQLHRSEAATDARLAALEGGLRGGMAALQAEMAAQLGQARQETAALAQAERESGINATIALREEIARCLQQLGETLTGHLVAFRRDSLSELGQHRANTSTAAETLRTAVKQDLDAMRERLSGFIAEAARHQTDAREALHNRLASLGSDQQTHHERLRSVVEQRLELLNTTNTAKLEEMRATVDEKLHATLHTRLTESFGQVTDQLSKVHTGLGEMSKLSEGVDGLSRIFTNVKSRGGFAEVQLGMLLEQMLAPSQFVRNARIKPNTQEVVEFAVRFPGHTGEMLLPIDAKFPREDWERLESAYESGSHEQISAAGRSFEAAIRTEGKRICEKYIEPPATTPYGIMFLPTEGLYAEVMRREGLQAELQTRCKVTIAGPSTLAAILSSFQMGFHMLAIQKKGGEVWNILHQTRSEFGKFEDLMGSMEKQVGTVQNTIQKLGVRTRAINKTLRDVGEVDAPAAAPVLGFPEASLASLAAAADDEG